jgi:cytidylate kinase
LRSIIAIGGPHGSGKSSVARKLSEKYNMNYVSAGSVFRGMAKERHLSLKEFSELVINEPDIDREIDDRTKELSKVDNTIVDAQLAVHFTPQDTLLKMCITASKDIRWDRIARRENISIEEAKTETLTREKSEQDRYFKLYQIDVWDTSFYDIIINSDRLDADQTYSICSTIVKHFLTINEK